MFSERFTSSDFTSDLGDKIFSNIGVTVSYDGDISCATTARILLSPRIPKEENIMIALMSSRAPSGVWSNIDIKNRLYNIAESDHSLIFCNIIGSYASAEFDYVSEHFGEVYNGFVRVRKITSFFEKTMPVCCYVNAEKKASVIFCMNMNIEKWHFIQLAILPALPWYVGNNTYQDENEKALLASLASPRMEDYAEAVKRCAEKFNFREQGIRAYLDKIETAAYRKQIREYESNISSSHNRIESYNERIAEALEQIERYEILLWGTQQALANHESGGSQIMQYFLANKNIDLVYAEDEYIDFTVKQFCNSWEKQSLLNILSSRGNCIISSGNGIYSGASFEKLIRAIFIDETLKLQMCGKFRYKIGLQLKAVSDATFPSTYDDAMPNPHLQHYSCIGQYELIFNELIQSREHNDIMILEQTSQSVASLNWADTTVVHNFVSDINRTNTKCIQLPSGEMVDPAHAVAWLLKQEEEKANAENNESEENANE